MPMRFITQVPFTRPSGTATPLHGHDAILMAAFTEQDRRHARDWFWGFVVACGLAAFFAALFAWQAAQSTVATVVIELLRSADGAVAVIRSVRPAEEPYDPPIGAKVDLLQRFILATQGLSTDAKMVRTQWDWAAAVCAGLAYTQLQDMGSARNLQAEIGQQAREVRFLRTLQSTDDTWDITWEVKITHQEKREIAREIWSGQFTVFQRTPINTQEVSVSPLGIWLRDFRMTRTS